ncbi:hypothetical protein [Streptomyces pseudovenezuelae]|uniref:hypothetical protein n=1 Tax=Streptomyces pseudovenezuelae TaxID=67350 RepID=UPI002E809147|nr:hypothetical protein [Streptomyces pseudovenezuelae]WUA85788.1 hypothetical protein OHO81_00010 [Streptomyces pseudovenezuelae]WUA93978.1 hypothetical protein OHO81_44605 [Streptomyces pseudovenezuelae]
MSSRVTPDAATVKADVDAVLESLAQAMDSFEAEFESDDGIRTVWREELATLTLHTIQKVRGYMRDLHAIAAGACPDEDKTGVVAQQLERNVLGPLARGLIGGMLLKLDRLLRRPFLVRPYQAQAAALIARNAAIEGDRGAVDDFSRKVLGLKHPARWREAVEMALLGDWVESLGAGTATKPYVHGLLRRHARVQHRYLQPVWKGRINGEPTVLLAQPIDEARTIADLLVEYRTPEQDLLSKQRDIRVSTVLKQLSAEELAMALAWAEHGGHWPAVANELGQERKFGERVRCKLSRLGKRYADRAAEAERTKRRMR